MRVSIQGGELQTSNRGISKSGIAVANSPAIDIAILELRPEEAK